MWEKFSIFKFLVFGSLAEDGKDDYWVDISADDSGNVDGSDQGCRISGSMVALLPGTFTQFTRFLHDFTRFLRNFTCFYTILRIFCDFYAIFCQAQIFCCQAPKTILHPCM